MDIKKVISELSDQELIQAIEELDYITWEEDAILRKLAIKVFGKDNVVEMLALAPKLALELLKRAKPL